MSKPSVRQKQSTAQVVDWCSSCLVGWRTAEECARMSPLLLRTELGEESPRCVHLASMVLSPVTPFTLGKQAMSNQKT